MAGKYGVVLHNDAFSALPGRKGPASSRLIRN